MQIAPLKCNGRRLVGLIKGETGVRVAPGTFEIGIWVFFLSVSTANKYGTDHHKSLHQVMDRSSNQARTVRDSLL
jgi:hypothetical protein